jgi:hypothetical protein
VHTNRSHDWELANPDVLWPFSRVAALQAVNFERIVINHGVMAYLLDEAGNVLAMALPDQVPSPVNLKWPRPVTALASDYGPVDAGKIKFAKVFNDGFEGYKPYSHMRGLEMCDTR